MQTFDILVQFTHWASQSNVFLYRTTFEKIMPLCDEILDRRGSNLVCTKKIRQSQTYIFAVLACILKHMELKLINVGG